MARFPAMWRSDRPLIFGHRGASQRAPENTLPAFRAALEAGADGVELDVHLSADSVPVVIHDDRVDTTTDGTGAVASLTLAQLQALDAGGGFDPRFAGARIPTLEQVLREVGPRLWINVEVKVQQGLKAIVAAVRRTGMAARVWFSSFRPYTLYRLRALAPEVACGLLYAPPTAMSLLLRPFTPHEALHPHVSMVTSRFVRRAQRQGLRVVAWTVDEPAMAQQLAAWGVDAIITNAPAALRASLVLGPLDQGAGPR